MVRVHRFGLAAGQAEETMVEQVDPVQVRRLRIVGGRIEPGDLDPLLGQRAYAVPALGEQGPEAGQVWRAGKAGPPPR